MTATPPPDVHDGLRQMLAQELWWFDLRIDALPVDFVQDWLASLHGTISAMAARDPDFADEVAPEAIRGQVCAVWGHLTGLVMPDNPFPHDGTVVALLAKHGVRGAPLQAEPVRLLRAAIAAHNVDPRRYPRRAVERLGNEVGWRSPPRLGESQAATRREVAATFAAVMVEHLAGTPMPPAARQPQWVGRARYVLADEGVPAAAAPPAPARIGRVLEPALELLRQELAPRGLDPARFPAGVLEAIAGEIDSGRWVRAAPPDDPRVRRQIARGFVFAMRAILDGRAVSASPRGSAMVEGMRAIFRDADMPLRNPAGPRDRPAPAEGNPG